MSRSSRREFLRDAALAAGALAAVPRSLAAPAGAKATKTRVVVVTCPDVIAEGRPVNAAALRKMMDTGITALSGRRDVKEAWGTFIKPGDKVALADAGTWLVNVPEVVVEVMRGITLASPQAATLTYCALDHTKPEFLDQLTGGLKAAGLSTSLMDGSVYTIHSQYHAKSYSSLVMVPTLKSHSIAGVSGVIKHFATMSKGGPAPHHANAMETAGSVIVPEFGRMKQLFVVDALRFGDTTRGPQYYQKSLIFGTDPVATDVVALEVFLRHCKTYGDLPPDRHRVLADTRYKAGTSSRANMEVKEIRV